MKLKRTYTEREIIEAVRAAAKMSPGGGPGEDNGEYADGAVSVLSHLGIDTPKDLKGPDEQEQRRRDHWEGP